jgi:hypothetical protein
MTSAKRGATDHMRSRARWRYWVILGVFSVAAVALLVSSALTKLPDPYSKLTQSIGEALVVAVVVSLAVEPRLLRFFGEEIASQTFWSSFYSRAPDGYREAIKELASAERFAVHTQWWLTFDWVDEERAAIKASATCNNLAENRGARSHNLQPTAFAYESIFPELPATYNAYEVTCQDSEFYIDLIKDGLVRIEHADDGRLMVLPRPERAEPFFSVPSGQRYTVKTTATTYFGPTGYVPLIMVSPTLKCTLQLSGTALPDLYLSVMHPSLGTIASPIKGAGKELSERGEIDMGSVFITGQVIMLSWKLLTNQAASPTPSNHADVTAP